MKLSRQRLPMKIEKNRCAIGAEIASNVDATGEGEERLKKNNRRRNKNIIWGLYISAIVINLICYMNKKRRITYISLLH